MGFVKPYLAVSSFAIKCKYLNNIHTCCENWVASLDVHVEAALVCDYQKSEQLSE